MFVQILASSAWTGVVWTISVRNASNSSAALEPEPSPTPPTTQGSVAISSRKWFSAIRSGTCETNRSSPTRKPRRCSMYPATHSVVPGATVERRISEWPSRSTGSRSSITPRTCEMSISMCTCDGVWSVSTMWSALAASCTARVSSSLPPSTTRPSTSSVPVSENGIRPADSWSSTSCWRSTPIVRRPRSANDSARGRPTRPRPTTATLASMSGSLFTLAQVLARKRQHEARIEVQVARQQPAWLLGYPVDPLEPALLHPRGRLRDPARVEVERGADGAHHGDVEPLPHARHPLLLLRHADADPQHVRARLVDLLDERILLLGGHRPERRGVAPDDVDAGVARAQVQRELDERALITAAVEPHAMATLGAAVVVAQHQLRTVDAVVEVTPEQVRGPDHGHAVGQHERRAPECLAHLGIVVADRERVHGHRAHVAALAARDHRVHGVDRGAVVGQRDRSAEDVPGGDLGGRRGGLRYALWLRLNTRH